jgi:hypothetical protein
LSGSVALGLISLAMIIHALQDYDRLRTVYGPSSFVMVLAAGMALLIGIWRPAPLVLVVTLAAI